MATIGATDPATAPLSARDISSDGIATSKPLLATVDDREIEKRDVAGAAQEGPGRRFWIRPLVLIIVPAVLTVYYAIIWIVLVLNLRHDEAASYRTYSGSLIFYSWFIIGVFAISWAKFGLLGLEASMIRTRFWRAPNLVAFLMHSNSTWSSPSGWFKGILHREFYRLWLLLSFLSFLPFIAIPLSGLVFEIADGYIKTSDAPTVKGCNRTTINQNYDGAKYDTATGPFRPARDAWKAGGSPVVPGIGIIYTNDALDRAEYNDFAEVPNSYPLTESIPDLFLPPQSDKPMEGKAWGLRIKYDCKTVESASEFTILSQKAESSLSPSCDSIMGDSIVGDCINLDTPSGGVIIPWNETQLGDSTFSNVGAYFETGMSHKPLLRNKMSKYNGTHPVFEAEEGENSQVFEYVVWQFRNNGQYNESDLVFDNNVGPSVAGLGSPFIKSGDGYADYVLNTTFFKVKGDSSGNTTDEGSTTDISQLMSFRYFDGGGLHNNSRMEWLELTEPIGVRCVSSSDLGYAEIDGRMSSFRDFERANPDFHEIYGYGSERFGLGTQSALWPHFYQHYISGGLAGTQPHENGVRYAQFVNANALLRSVNLMYAQEAHDLMYGVASGYKEEWTAEGMTSSREGKILTAASLIPGSGMGHFVLVLMCLWAALSAGLGLFYGFRRRPAEKLDGYEMLREGAERADELKANPDFMNREQFQGNKALAQMPGS